MSFLYLYNYGWILIDRSIIVEGKLYLIAVSAFHDGIAIFNALIGEAIVLAGGVNLGAVSLFYHYSSDIDRIRLELLDGGGWENRQ